MTYDIYSYGNGLALSDLLNGIVLVIGESGYDTFIGIGIMFAFGLIAISAMFDMKFGKIFKWYVSIMVIYAGLLVPKADVFIFDPVMLQITPTPVANVPIGLAFMLSTLTTIEYNLTNSVESALKTPQDLTYNSTGMLMASDMVRKASSFKILNQNFAQNIRSYLQQCVQYDILHGKYTVEELFHAPDIWEFTKAYNSPARAFMYNGNIQTCKDDKNQLENDWKNELDTSIQIFGKRIFGSHQAVNPDANPADLLVQYMEAGYAHLGKISGTASKIMQQNMMINAYHDSVINNAAELGAAAAVESYAVARATQNSRSAYKISGEVAGRLLPYLKNVMQMLLIGSSVVILPLFFFPSGFMRLKHFVEILASLSLWAPLYAILNLQMTTAGRWKIIGLTEPANATDHAAITIANMPGIEQIAADQAILAGYLALSIPLISYGLIKSSMHAFTSLASGVMSVAHSSASQAAEEAVSGNYSLGNLSMENTNAYNTSAFHDDENVRVSSGSTSVESMDGTINTFFANGDEKTDHRGAMSNMGVGVNYGGRLESSLMNNFAKSVSAAEVDSVDYSKAMSGVIGSVYEYSKIHGNGTSSDTTNSVGHSSAENKAFSEVVGLVENVMTQEGVTEKEAFGIVASAYVSAKIPFGPGLGISATSTNDSSVDHSGSSSTTSSDAQNVQTTIDDGIRFASDQNHRSTSDESNRLSENIRTGVDQAEAIRGNHSANIQNAENASQALSFVKADSAAITADGTQHVYEELRKTVNPETGSNYTNNDISQLKNDPLKFTQAVTPIVEADAARIIAKGSMIQEKGDMIESHYKANSQAILAKGEHIQADHKDKKGSLKNMADIKPVDDSAKVKVRDTLIKNDKEISYVKGSIGVRNEEMKYQLKADMKEPKAGKVIEAAAKRTIDFISPKDDE